MTRNKLFYVALIGLGLANLSACSQPTVDKKDVAATPPPAATTSPATAPAPAKKIALKSLCDILPEKEVSEIFGENLMGAQNNLPSTTTTFGCTYANEESGSSVTMIVNLDNEYQTAKSGYESAIEYQKESKTDAQKEFTATGVGEAAYGWSSSFLTQLNAYKGSAWFTLSLIKGDGSGEANIELAKKVANKVFEKL